MPAMIEARSARADAERRSPSPASLTRRLPVPLGSLMAGLPSAALLIACLCAWEGAVRIWQVQSYLLPAPSAVAARFIGDPLFFCREGLVTLGEALGGLTIGGALALGAGLLMAQWRWL